MHRFALGPGELLLIALIAILLFGNRLPELLRERGRVVSARWPSDEDAVREMSRLIGILLLAIATLVLLASLFHR